MAYPIWFRESRLKTVTDHPITILMGETDNSLYSIGYSSDYYLTITRLAILTGTTRFNIQYFYSTVPDITSYTVA